MMERFFKGLLLLQARSTLPADDANTAFAAGYAMLAAALNYRHGVSVGAQRIELDGFVRMDNLLPQEFIIQVIHQNGDATVERVQLDASNHLSLDLDLSDGPAILVVSGVTPFTTQRATYQFTVTEN